MKNRLLKIFVPIGVIILAIIVTIYSANYERIKDQTVVDGKCIENIKEICHPAGGFPFSFLFDSESTSVWGSLGFIEDDFSPLWFSIDVIFYFAIFFIFFATVKKFAKG